MAWMMLSNATATVIVQTMATESAEYLPFRVPFDQLCYLITRGTNGAKAMDREELDRTSRWLLIRRSIVDGRNATLTFSCMPSTQPSDPIEEGSMQKRRMAPQRNGSNFKASTFFAANEIASRERRLVAFVAP